MAARVRIPVQDNKAMLASIDEQVHLICCSFGCRAEDTLARLVLFFHVSGSPRRPQVGHGGQEASGARGVYFTCRLKDFIAVRGPIRGCTRLSGLVYRVP